MNTEFKPDLLPQRPGTQVTYGKNLTLWEPLNERYVDRYTGEIRLLLRLKKSEIDMAAEAMAIVMSQMIVGTLGNCEIVPEDGAFFTISWPTFVGSRHDDTPAFIYQFLKEYALISHEHKQEAKEIREWIRTNYPLPF